MPVKLPTSDNLGGVSLGGARRVVNMQAPANPFGGIAKGLAAVAEFGADLAARRQKERADLESNNAKIAAITGGDKFQAEIEKLDPLDTMYEQKVRGAFRKHVRGTALGGITERSAFVEWSQALDVSEATAVAEANGKKRKAVYNKNGLQLGEALASVERKSITDPDGNPENGLSIALDLVEKSDRNPEDKEKLKTELTEKFSIASINKEVQRSAKTGLFLTPEVSAALKVVEGLPNVPNWMAGYLGRLATVESSGGTNLDNPESEALGVFQFMPETGKQYGLKTDADRLDVAKSTEAAIRLTMDNHKALKNALGREPTQGELYLAHQQGATGALKLLQNPDARAVDIVGEDAVVLNGGFETMTADQFVSLWDDGFEKDGFPDDEEEAARLLTKLPGFNRLSPEAQAEVIKSSVDYSKALTREQEQLRREQRDEIYSQFAELDAGGQLTKEWVDAQEASGIPTAREVRTFRLALAKAPKTVDDKDAVADLATAVNGASKLEELDDADRQLAESFAAGEITSATRTRIAAGVKARRIALKAGADRLQRAEKLIQRTVTSRDYSTGDIVEDELSVMAGKTALANWLDLNPKATELEVMKAAGEIAQGVALDRVEAVRASLPPPPGLDGRPVKSITRDDIIAVAAGLSKQEPIPGREAEYAGQVELLKRWLEIIDIAEPLTPTKNLEQ